MFFSNAQVVFSPNEKGELVCQGKFAFEKTEDNLINCIVERDFIGSLKRHIAGEKAQLLQFEYKYNYYALDEVTPIGQISFQFDYKIENGILEYTFYNFTHHKGDSNIESLGVLPFAMNEKVKQVFSEDQYAKTLFSQKFNISNLLRMLKKYCLD